MKLALAHDYLIQMGGAERVVATMHRRFPEAPIFTSAVCRKTLWEDFQDADIRTTWMQALPFIQDSTHFKKYFPLYPLAFRSFGAVDADVAWVSSSTFAKYMRFTSRTRTICYLHNTTRFLWQTDEYVDHEVANSSVNRLVRFVLPIFRRLDRNAVLRMDTLVANSRNVQERIRKFYGRDSVVIHPPVETSRFEISYKNESYYLIVSRLLGYKNIDLAVRAFTRSGRRLVVLGDGPHRRALEQQAGESVQILGRLSDDETRSFFGRCRGFVFPGDEDFGITPVEAMACGKPVIAFKKGGSMETLVDGETGVFFEEQTEDSLLEAVDRAERATWDPERIHRHAERFSENRFLKEMEAVLVSFR